jgi:DGQHR domain-containing protein
MAKPYSANNEFKILTSNLGFKPLIFDDENLFGKGVKLNERSKKQEIDGIAYTENIVCLFGITKSTGYSAVEHSFNRYFEKLDKVEDYNSLDLEIHGGGSAKTNSKLKEALLYLKEVQDQIKKYSTSHKHLLFKVFFCPFCHVPQETILARKESNEIIIDKDLYDYFQVVGQRLGKEYMKYDFLAFLGVKKSDMAKLFQGKSSKPAQSVPYICTKLKVDQNTTLFSIIPSIDDMKEYATVLRIAGKYDKKAFQRMIKSNRLEKINNDYLNYNYTFPNNVIVALNPEIYKNEEEFYNEKTLQFQFYQEFNSLFIIDGQHRFFAFIHGKKTDRQIIVTLLHFKHEKIEDSYLEMSNMFYDINKKSEKIDPNLAFNILAKIKPESEENFWLKVFEWLIENNKFFKDKYSFRENTIKEVKKKSIVSVLQYGGILKLNKTIKRGIIVDGLASFYNNLKRDDQIQFAGTLLDNYFDILDTVIHAQGLSKDDIGPREVGALCRLLRHFLISDKTHIKVLGEIRHAKKQNMPACKAAALRFTKILTSVDFKDIIDLDVPSSNWAAVEGALLSGINKLNKNFGSTNLLSKKGLEYYS